MHLIAHFLMRLHRLLQVVNLDPDVLDSLAMVFVQKVGIDIRRVRRRRDPLVAELGMPLIADLKRQ